MMIFLALGYMFLKSVAVGKIMAQIWERRTKVGNKLKLGSKQVVQKEREDERHESLVMMGCDDEYNYTLNTLLVNFLGMTRSFFYSYRVKCKVICLC